MTNGTFNAAVGRLRQCLVEVKKTGIWENIVEPRDGVIARFGSLLQPGRIPNLTEEEIRPFFYLENNHHWSNLNRQVNRLCGNMPAFRKVLITLVDEQQPIADRLDAVIDTMTGLGKGILSALLIVAFPDKYGVWNSTSQGGLIAVGLFPDFERGTPFGAKYDRINAVLNDLATALEIDLWTLDALWWQAAKTGNDSLPSPEEIPRSSFAPGDGQQFHLEEHLHVFLRDNWDNTDLGKDWAIYSEPGEPDAGYKYQCGVGEMDFLARHRTEKKWLVVELAGARPTARSAARSATC